MKRKNFLLFVILIMALIIGLPAEAKTKVASTKINKIKTDGANVTLSFKKVKNASGYQIYRSTKKNKGFKKIATLKGKNKISYTDKKVKENTQYFYKIKCYVQKGKKKTYSAFCAVKSIKTKEKDKEEEKEEEKKFVKVTGIKLNYSYAVTAVGKRYAVLKPIISPSDATNKNVTWSSSNTKVATVDSEGVITTKAVGTTIVTVTTADGGFTANCELTCNEVLTSANDDSYGFDNTVVVDGYNITNSRGVAKLTWKPVKNVTRYRLDRKGTGEGSYHDHGILEPFTPMGDSQNKMYYEVNGEFIYADTECDKNKAYDYRVTAISSSGVETVVLEQRIAATYEGIINVTKAKAMFERWNAHRAACDSAWGGWCYWLS